MYFLQKLILLKWEEKQFKKCCCIVEKIIHSLQSATNTSCWVVKQEEIFYKKMHIGRNIVQIRCQDIIFSVICITYYLRRNFVIFLQLSQLSRQTFKLVPGCKLYAMYVSSIFTRIRKRLYTGLFCTNSKSSSF